MHLTVDLHRAAPARTAPGYDCCRQAALMFRGVPGPTPELPTPAYPERADRRLRRSLADRIASIGCTVWAMLPALGSAAGAAVFHAARRAGISRRMHSMPNGHSVPCGGRRRDSLYCRNVAAAGKGAGDQSTTLLGSCLVASY